MPWVRFTDEGGRNWQINQFGLWLLVRQYLHAELVLSNSRTETTHRWFYPDIVNVNVDFRAVRRQKDDLAPRMYDEIARESIRAGEVAMRRIVDMRRNTDAYTTSFRNRMQSASHQTMGNIDHAVRIGEAGAATARVVRDISAGVLVAGATFLSGGAALSVLGAGSGLKGVSTYQDTGNVGAALLDATGTFVVGAIPIGAMASRGQTVSNSISLASRAGGSGTSPLMSNIVQNVREQGAVIVVGASVNAGFEMSRGMVEGRTMEESVRSAGASFGVDLISGGILGPVLDQCSLPIAVRLVTETATGFGGGELVSAASLQDEVARAPLPFRNIVDSAPIVDNDLEFIHNNVFRPA